MFRTPAYFYLPLITPAYRNTRRGIARIAYANLRGPTGSGVHCPICERDYRSWVGGKKNGICPVCHASTRHRLMWLHLQEATNRFAAARRLLYFAPDGCLERRFKRIPTLTCTTTDLSSPDVDVHADITNLSFKDASYDMIICSHVLEHIVDDKTAMAQMCRVLAPGGEAYIQVPYSGKLAVTDEDPTVTDPKERERRFQQFDHVRRYGQDIVDRLASAGFTVNVAHPARSLAPETAARFGLWDDTIFHCQKPAVPAPVLAEADLRTRA